MSDLVWLDPDSLEFPDTQNALDDPNGLLAVGGDLSPARIINAYRQGIFPWYSPGQPILWWSPEPRMALHPSDIYLGRTLRKTLKKRPFKITVDSAFEQVIYQCATVQRNGEDGTWITQEMYDAYIELHRQGIAHSIEAWADNQLVGGLYGLGLGQVFFGESMFSLRSNASKVAFATLAEQLKHWGFGLIDCQIHTDYLETFGAREIERDEFENQLKALIPSDILESRFSIFDWKAQWSMPEFGLE